MKKIVCKLFGHKYKLFRNVSPTIRELECERCKKIFGMNDDAKVVLPMDFELWNLHNNILFESKKH